MSKGVYIGIVVILLGGAAWYVSSTRSSDTQQSGSDGTETSATGDSSTSQVLGPAVPDLELKDYNGEEVALHSLIGKPLVVNSWAAWCPFCIDELPDFAALQQEFGNDVVIVAINRSETKRTAQKYTDDLGIGDDLVFLLDASDSFYRSIGGFSMPETLFVNSDGTVNFHKRGVMQQEEIRQRIQELITSP